jgi:pyrroline-5-carboxylate reductase
MKLLIVGGGRMGEALVGGLLAAGWASPAEVGVTEPIAARRDELSARYAGVRVLDEVVEADGAVIAVKPAEVASACATVVADRVLSIAAGVSIATLESALPGKPAVVRAMPNTPALIGAGAAAISAGANADDDDLSWAEGILGAVGDVVRVPEKLLDAVTGLSGSGPAYVFLVAEARVDAGVLAGLPREVSARLATQTLLGSARLLAESGDTAEVLRGQVTSPGGTTAAGLRALEAAGVRSAFLEAVTAAAARASELGQG